MTPEEKAEFTDELTEKFVLVPKNKLYYIIGGAVAVIVIATGLSLASVFAYLRSEPAEIARKRIEQIRAQAEVHLKRLEQSDSYVQFDQTIALESEKNTGYMLTGHSQMPSPHPPKSSDVNAEPILHQPPFYRWTVRRPPSK